MEFAKATFTKRHSGSSEVQTTPMQTWKWKSFTAVKRPSSSTLERFKKKDVVDTGRKLVGTQAGLLFEITKEATAKDLVVYPYAIADASLYISSMETKLNVAR